MLYSKWGQNEHKHQNALCLYVGQDVLTSKGVSHCSGQKYIQRAICLRLLHGNCKQPFARLLQEHDIPLVYIGDPYSHILISSLVLLAVSLEVNLIHPRIIPFLD